jgi:predicted DNA-binding transcriptional regulator YafY
MRTSRLLSILILLQTRGRITADALADEFRVSVRTIYRDVDELAAAGIPVQSDRGPGGGFHLLDGYRTRLTGLAADEVEAMLLIGLPAQAAALGLGPSAQQARGKLLASLPAAMGEGAGRIGARFHLDPVDWYRAAKPVGFLPPMARAVLDQRIVKMTYESWTSTRERMVEPLGIVLKAGAWYVVAASRGRLATFKVANIRALELQPGTFRRPAAFDLASYWAESLRRFEAGLRPHKALLRASAAGLARLAQLGAYAAEAINSCEPADTQGWSRLELPYENIEQAALALLGIGPELRVDAPVELRVRIRELAQQVAKNARA